MQFTPTDKPEMEKILWFIRIGTRVFARCHFAIKSGPANTLQHTVLMDANRKIGRACRRQQNRFAYSL